MKFHNIDLDNYRGDDVTVYTDVYAKHNRSIYLDVEIKEDNKCSFPKTWNAKKCGVILFATSALIAVGMFGRAFKSSAASPPTLYQLGGSENGTDSTDQAIINIHYDKDGKMTHSCPAETDLAKFKDESFQTASDGSTQKVTHNMKKFKQNFRQEEFEDWEMTYDEVKKHVYDYKTKYFVPYMENGYSIYESACGIGLNLYMTLEVLYEVKGVENVVVYGNEYVASSANTANEIYDQIAPANAKKGTICTADSADLSHVPGDAFDLVYTGYISSLMDPLHVKTSSNEKDFEYYDLYNELCDSHEKDWKAKKLLEIARKRQDEWFAKWIGEMIRIAKPGAPVIFEQVMRPYCSNPSDWDGVSEAWWYIAIDEYGWDVDKDSLEMQEDHLFEDRYNVFMMKKQAVAN